jgi:hypothetical protein
MISGGILFNLFASALEIILYITLQRLIGRNWLKDIGFWTFGTKTINVPFIFIGISSPLSTQCTILVISSPQTTQLH